jgi:ATP-dependent helicase/nuclease subunit B
VTGTADRVDVYEKDGRLYTRVVDYKTGARAFSLTDVYHGLGIQMLVYLFALWEKGELRYGKPVVPAGVLYLHAHQPVASLKKTASDEEVEAETRRQLKMNGLVIADREIVEAMEKGISGSGRFIPVQLLKDGSFGRFSSVASVEQFGRLKRHVEKIVREMGRAALNGDIQANPYLSDRGATPCSFCDYREACLFDITNGCSRYRIIKSFPAAEFWEKIGEEGEHGANPVD